MTLQILIWSVNVRYGAFLTLYAPLFSALYVVYIYIFWYNGIFLKVTIFMMKNLDILHFHFSFDETYINVFLKILEFSHLEYATLLK